MLPFHLMMTMLLLTRAQGALAHDQLCPCWRWEACLKWCLFLLVALSDDLPTSMTCLHTRRLNHPRKPLTTTGMRIDLLGDEACTHRIGYCLELEEEALPVGFPPVYIEISQPSFGVSANGCISGHRCCRHRRIIS